MGLINEALEDARREGAAQERAKIVAWLEARRDEWVETAPADSEKSKLVVGRIAALGCAAFDIASGAHVK